MKNFNLIKDFKINKLQNMAILLMTILMSQFSWAQLFPVGGACYATTPLGNGTYAMASNNVPLSTNRVATIYPATQLAGIAGQTLTSLYLKKITATNIGGTPNFKVYLKNTSALDFGDASADWTTLVTGATLVYNSNPAVAAAGPAGWKEFVLSTNFNYTTGSNLMVLFEYVNTGNTTNVTWEYEWNNPCVDVTNDNTTKNQTNNDGTLPDLLTATNYRRAKIGFDYLVSCPAPTALLQITLQQILQRYLGLQEVLKLLGIMW